MSDTTKTILIVGGAAVGLYLLWQGAGGGSGTAVTRRPPGSSPWASAAAAALAPALAVGVNNLTRPTLSASNSGTVYGAGYDQGGYVTSGAIDTTAQADYALSHDVVAQQGNVLVNQNTGNALIYGTD